MRCITRCGQNRAGQSERERRRGRRSPTMVCFPLLSSSLLTRPAARLSVSWEMSSWQWDKGSRKSEAGGSRHICERSGFGVLAFSICDEVRSVRIQWPSHCAVPLEIFHHWASSCTKSEHASGLALAGSSSVFALRPAPSCSLSGELHNVMRYTTRRNRLGKTCPVPWAQEEVRIHA